MEEGLEEEEEEEEEYGRSRRPGRVPAPASRRAVPQGDALPARARYRPDSTGRYGR